MSFGYTCDWCNARGKSESSDQRDPNPLPRNWATLSYNEHVCGDCIRKAKSTIVAAKLVDKTHKDPRSGVELNYFER